MDRTDNPARGVPRGRGREVDKQVAAAAIVVTFAFLGLAVLAVLVPVGTGGVVAPWLPLHLALAGGATTAIAGIMPFFVGALAGAPPANARLRSAAVVLVAAGALGIATRGIWPGIGWIPVAGAVAYLAGIAATAVATRRASQRGMLARRPVVMAAYALALGNVAVGATIGLLVVAGWLPVLEGWGTLRLAHAWANLVGFVSLVVIGTLLYLLPTIIASLIVQRRTGVVTVLGVGLGAPAVALGAACVVAGEGAGIPGLATAGAWLARAGAGATVVAAGALLAEAVLVVRSRRGWTTDQGWHRISEGALLAGVGWFVVGIVLVAGPVVIAGPTAASWSTSLAVPSLVLGWVVQILLGSWSHIVPWVLGGGETARPRRTILGRWAWTRLVSLNAGTALVAVGWPAQVAELAAAGITLVAASLVVSLLLGLAAYRPVRIAA